MNDAPFDFDAHFGGTDDESTAYGEVDPRLLEVLVCPVTHGTAGIRPGAARTGEQKGSSRLPDPPGRADHAA